MYHLHRDELLKKRGFYLPRAASTIWRVLKDGGRIPTHVRSHHPIERPDPMQHWEMDFGANADGTNRREISILYASIGNLNWTTDNRIIFSAYFLELSIFSIPVTGGDLSKLNEPELEIPTSSWSGPNLSPDEHKIAFTQGDQLATMDIDGSNVSSITGDSLRVWDPDWQPIPTPTPPSITNFVLVDADTDEDTRPLTEDNTITQDTFTIRVDTTPPKVGSVVFSLNDNPRFKVENQGAYALQGDDNGDYHAWLAQPGTYTLIATPYTKRNGQGEAGTPLTITFTVEASGS